VAARPVSDTDLWPRAQFWSHSLTIAGSRRGPLGLVDLPEHPGRSVLKCWSSTSKAREGTVAGA